MQRVGIRKSIHGKACAMQTTNTYLGLLRERGKRRMPLTRVYRQLLNKHLYLTAYAKIYRNAGATTKGINAETVDAMSLEKIDTIIEALRTERYQWKPARRVYILKRNGKKRPLGLPIWASYCTSLQNEFGIALTRLVAWVWIGRTDPHLFDCTI